MNKKAIHWSSSLRARLGGEFPAIGRAGIFLARRFLPRRLRGNIFPDIAVDLDLSDLTMLSTYWQGKRFESPTGSILEEWCNGAERFFDIGSNYGFYSWWMTSHSPSLLVYPFEPNPKTFSKLSAICSENCLNNVRPQNCGLADAKQTLLLHEGVEDSGHSTFGAHPDLGRAPIAKVAVLPFDSWLQENNISLPTTPKWVAKIDVEGFELKVIRGMEQTLRAKAFRGISLEINAFTLSFCETDGSEISQFLKACGYAELNKTEQGRKWSLERCGNSFFVPE